MTTTQVVETSVTVNKNSPIQDYIHLDNQTQPTFKVKKNYEHQKSPFYEIAWAVPQIN